MAQALQELAAAGVAVWLDDLRARPPISESARGWDCETGILLSGVAP
jgi:hypothetical protein